MISIPIIGIPVVCTHAHPKSKVPRSLIIVPAISASFLLQNYDSLSLPHLHHSFFNYRSPDVCLSSISASASPPRNKASRTKAFGFINSRIHIGYCQCPPKTQTMGAPPPSIIARLTSVIYDRHLRSLVTTILPRSMLQNSIPNHHEHPHSQPRCLCSSDAYADELQNSGMSLMEAREELRAGREAGGGR
jgi:hypothetical protein